MLNVVAFHYYVFELINHHCCLFPNIVASLGDTGVVLGSLGPHHDALEPAHVAKVMPIRYSNAVEVTEELSKAARDLPSDTRGWSHGWKYKEN